MLPQCQGWGIFRIPQRGRVPPKNCVSRLREGTYVHRLSRPNADKGDAQLQNLWSSIAQDVFQNVAKVNVVRPQVQGASAG
eukprot:12550353-Alexandrium_andersonii.AAC.1